jgi:pyruvate dehydrogenase (quinone)/pyruvate oxidase
MAKTAADILVETMLDWGIDTIFGIPGDGINGIIEALRKQKEKIRFIQVRHEARVLHFSLSIVPAD